MGLGPVYKLAVARPVISMPQDPGRFRADHRGAYRRAGRPEGPAGCSAAAAGSGQRAGAAGGYHVSHDGGQGASGGGVERTEIGEWFGRRVWTGGAQWSRKRLALDGKRCI